MYFDNAPGNVFRPPSEAQSFILRVTLGCSHNKCTYCNMYRDVQFQVRTEAEVSRQIQLASAYKEFIRRIFLADGDALILATPRLLSILAELKATFPRLQRVSCYASPKSILRKTPEELQALKNAGLKLVYYGMESGSDQVLTAVNKGVNAAESIAAGQKIVQAGMKLSLMVIIGLGGVPGSREHAQATAQAINLIQPNMLSALTLMLYRGSELLEEFEAGRFTPLNPYQIMLELEELVQAIELPSGSHCIFRSNHISNYVQLAGNLPADKPRLLADIKLAAQELKQLKEYDVYNNVEY